MKRLVKRAAHDLPNRDSALLIINGRLYEDRTHALALEQYLNELRGSGYDIPGLDSTLTRPDIENTEEVQGLRGNERAAFAHKVDDEHAIYVEKWSLINMSINQAAIILKQHFPDYAIYDDDGVNDEGDYTLLMARLRSAWVRCAQVSPR